MSSSLWPMECGTPGWLVLHHLPEFTQTRWCHPTISASVVPFLLLPLIFLSIRVFSRELALHIRWSKYWSFSISPANEYSGLISSRIDWFDLLAFQGTLKSLRTIPSHVLESHPRYYITCICVSLVFSRLDYCSEWHCSLWTWQFWRILVRYFTECSSIWFIWSVSYG